MNGKPQKEMATQMPSMSLRVQQQIIKTLYPTINTDFSLTLKKEQIIRIYYGIQNRLRLYSQINFPQQLKYFK